MMYRYPINGWNGMMGGIWLFQTYHILAAVLFLVILFLIAVFLWKKIELLDHELSKKNRA